MTDAHSTDPGDGFPGDAPPALPAKQTARISLREMADDAHRELTRRHRVCAGMAKHGSMSEVEAAAEIAVARAIRNTLRLLAEHEDAVRATLAREIAAARAHPAGSTEESRMRELESHPAVSALREAFPDAEVAAVRPLYQHTEYAASGRLDEGESDAATRRASP